MNPETWVRFYEDAVRGFLFNHTDPEAAHNAALRIGEAFGKYGATRKLTKLLFDYEDPALETSVWGIRFRNPVGLAAGFDKNGSLLDIAPCLGFGYEEEGSVTALGCEGNKGQRLWRLPDDEALINWMGLNNRGADAVHEKQQDKEYGMPVGINITRTNNPSIVGPVAIDDFMYSLGSLYQLADFIVLNIGCPNTAERTFEDPSALRDLLSAASARMSQLESKYGTKPVLLKPSLDLSKESLDAVLEVSCPNVDGYVIANTTKKRDGLKTDPKVLEAIGKGGLSGRPLRKRANGMIRYVHSRIPDKPIIGVGGISTPEEAFEDILAGASLVEVLTGLVYKGPGFAGYLNKGLSRLLKEYGFSSVSEAVGAEGHLKTRYFQRP